MGIYTDTGLVKHTEAALARNTKYMWGGIMRLITDSYVNMLRSTYGTKSGTGYSEQRYAQLKELIGKGFYGCDCVGLIKSYYWSGKPDGGTGSPNYGKAGFPDVNANYMYQQAKVKGAISTLPERPGVIVYCKTHPHVGVYVGNGWVIESTLSGRGDGVVKTRLSDFGWEYWFECPYIDYPKAADETANKTYFRVGDNVYIKDTAKYYAGTDIPIPKVCKGIGKSWSVAKVIPGRALIKELFSWVELKDIAKK